MKVIEVALKHLVCFVCLKGRAVERSQRWGVNEWVRDTLGPAIQKSTINSALPILTSISHRLAYV